MPVMLTWGAKGPPAVINLSLPLIPLLAAAMVRVFLWLALVSEWFRAEAASAAAAAVADRTGLHAKQVGEGWLLSAPE